MDMIKDQPNDLLMAPGAPPPPYEEAIADRPHQFHHANLGLTDPSSNATTTTTTTNTSAFLITTPGPGAAINHQLEEPNCRWCCCSCCGIRSCVRAIGIYEIVLLIITTVVVGLLASYLTVDEGKYLITGVLVVACFITVLVLAMLFYGISAERPGYLIPYMVLQVLAMVGGVAVFVAQFSAQSPTRLGTLTMGTLIRIYLLVQVKRCYDFLKLKSQSRRDMVGAWGEAFARGPV